MQWNTETMTMADGTMLERRTFTDAKGDTYTYGVTDMLAVKKRQDEVDVPRLFEAWTRHAVAQAHGDSAEADRQHGIMNDIWQAVYDGQALHLTGPFEKREVEV